ncbi:UDP-glucosyltransferase 2 [Procambarus clarkii]|uniref:UDP-glucosyltransferase 2 n=1 Tax=Procambarus clarkii TaxID=6728 RepID=UPI001E6786C3|nr:UDP-glucosyltransferase 2-like [Procambarus clarkii]XP_045608865.1 UDP-glucosyltransferase 2-like [Procambarus clarkii]
MQLWVMVVACGAVLQVAQASKFLFLGPLSSRSHKNFYMGIVNALADDGNQVTMVSSVKPTKVRENVREVTLVGVDIQDYTPNLFTGNRMAAPMTMISITPKLCSDALGKEEVQNLLKEDFDFILLSAFMSDCFLSVVYQLKVPFAFVSPAGLLGPLPVLMGNPSFPSYNPSLLLSSRHPLTFVERAISTLSEIATNVMFTYASSCMEGECRSRGLCPDDMPGFAEVSRNASLALINSVQTMEYPARPIVPNVVYCGGIHIHPAKPLPQDLEEWVQGAGDDGFIYFSLGSVVPGSTMPEEYRRAFIEVFGSLKQRVLWKWDQDTMEDLPPNVRISKWLPQQDILGDRRLHLFITHGGLLSTLESMYHGVPVLGMPVFGDQQGNMAKVERDGRGRVLLWEQLTSESLRDTINKIMNDSSMKAEVKESSKVMKDQPQDPAQVALYWLKYAIRHNGAPHLRCPAGEMSWYKLYNVDVWATVLVIELFSLYIFLRLVIACYSCLFSSKSKSKTD